MKQRRARISRSFVSAACFHAGPGPARSISARSATTIRSSLGVNRGLQGTADHEVCSRLTPSFGRKRLLNVAEEMALTERYSVQTENVVCGRHVKKEVRQKPNEKIVARLQRDISSAELY